MLASGGTQTLTPVRAIVPFLSMILFTLSAFAGEAIKQTTLPADPDAARIFDYCGAAGSFDNVDRRALAETANDRSGATPSSERATAVLVDAALSIVQQQGNPRRCKKAFEKGQRRFEKRLAKQQRQRGGGSVQDNAAGDSIEGVKAELRRLWVLDQAARLTYLDLRTDDRGGADFWAFRLSVAHAIMVDAESGAYLKRVLDQFDWVDIERFGEAASQRAWLLAQHADTDIDFQSLALSRMQPYVDKGGVSKQNYAFLWDRVAVNQDRPQRYGTQPAGGCVDGRLEPAPMEEPDSVDVRRAAMGLGPLEDYIDDMSRSRCR